MNDTPGWTSPGSAPSDGQDGSGVPRPSTPGDVNGSAPQWSKDQPPAGQWSPPTAPVPGQAPGPQPGPGWGGPPPQGYGNWGRPPAAKPGVIPLRPLGMGEILDGAVSTMRTYWRTVLPITVTVAVVSQIADILVQRFLMPTPPKLNPDPTPEEALAQLGDSLQTSLVASIPAILILIMATLVSAALLTVVISRAVLGRPVSLGAAWQEARPRLPRLVGLTLLLPLMSAGIMLVALLPGLLVGSAAGGALVGLGALGGLLVVIWLMVRFSLASPALMLERQGIVPSLKRSAKLVQGAWWRIFGITLLTQLILLFVAVIITLPFAIIAIAVDGDGFSGLLSGSTPEFGWSFLIITGIGGVIANAITYPISAGVTVLLYIDQRIRREALDLELARAAGVPGYGPAPDDPAAGS
ncbi:hypothetical protein Q5762_13645 [Streptomyces sp. P9(2023)]|uniref:hypothetical protein n=1 Tax=Streptomyces sp. P9(2023) TaxID=3064394 RepID=UPI0028F43195|nr:hypothetical protein [Streptomyces sp. P9(2023)]MDT9689363.1 hypothetical protein [Streptomyces sp. P9(2023)]